LTHSSFSCWTEIGRPPALSRLRESLPYSLPLIGPEGTLCAYDFNKTTLSQRVLKYGDLFQRLNPYGRVTKINYISAFGGNLCALGGWSWNKRRLAPHKSSVALPCTDMRALLALRHAIHLDKAS
jgi:hypothetical protein